MSLAARRLAVPLLALAAAWSSGCARDLDLPVSQPPRVDAVALVGLEPQAVSSGLPVLGGELVAIRGSGFPSSAAEVEVTIGAEVAEVLEARQDRLVARVPAAGTYGATDLQVQTAIGLRRVVGAFRYEGAGQPSGFASSELDTTVKLGFVTPVFPPGAHGFADYAVATGASDSALLLAPTLGYAVGAVPLGVVPTAAASWIDLVGSTARLNVLAVARGGDAAPLDAALGTVLLDGSSLKARASARRLGWWLGSPSACASPLVLVTYLGAPVVTWAEGALANRHRLAAIDLGKARDSDALAAVDPAAVHTLAGAVAGWGPWGASSVVLAAGGELYAYDAAAPAAPPRVLRIAKGGGAAAPVSALLAPGGAGCPAGIERIYAVTTAAGPAGEALAVSYHAGGADRVAIVELGPGPGAGTVRSGVSGLPRSALALAPDPAYEPSAGWQLLGSGGGDVVRFRPVAGAPACGELVPDAALRLSDTPAYVGAGGMATVADGTRVLAVTPDADVVTLLPPTLTSAGPVLRVASYGGVSVQQLTVGGSATPVVIAEHAAIDSAASEIDTGSALLAVSLAGDGGSVALGGGGYGRGAVWLETGAGGVLAYTGDLRSAGETTFLRGGVASVTPFGAPRCGDETVRLGAWRPIVSGPDLVAQGPARAGALGPSGVARFGPAVPPIYAVKDTTLSVYLPEAARLQCLAGAEAIAPDWSGGACAPDATVALGFQPLDVTVSAGDRVAALRTLEPCSNTCRPGDEVCLRARCPPARQLVLLWPDPGAVTSVVVPLPASPLALVADRGGGFLATLRCGAATAAGGACFGADPLCAGYATAPGDENGALVHVREDGSGVDCLAVLPGLAGPLAVTPNGAEAWVAGTTSSAEWLVRLGLPRRTSDGGLDVTRPAVLVGAERLYTAAGSPPPGGVAFTPDGATGVVTVPGQFRVLVRE